MRSAQRSLRGLGKVTVDAVGRHGPSKPLDVEHALQKLGLDATGRLPQEELHLAASGRVGDRHDLGQRWPGHDGLVLHGHRRIFAQVAGHGHRAVPIDELDSLGQQRLGLADQPEPRLMLGQTGSR